MGRVSGTIASAIEGRVGNLVFGRSDICQGCPRQTIQIEKKKGQPSEENVPGQDVHDTAIP